MEKELTFAGLTGFVSLLKQAGLMSELEVRARNGSALSLFAPTNEALMRTDPALLAFLKLPRNEAMLRDVLLYHVIEKPVSAFAWEGSYTTLQGAPIQLHVDALAFQVGESTVKQYKAVTMSMGMAEEESADVFAGTVVVHSMNALLVPPFLDETFLHTDLNVIVGEANEFDVDQGLYGSDIRRSMLAGAPGSMPLPGPPVTPPPPPPTESPVQPLPTPPPPTTAPPPPKSAPGSLAFRQLLPTMGVALLALVALFFEKLSAHHGKSVGHFPACEATDSAGGIFPMASECFPANTTWTTPAFSRAGSFHSHCTPHCSPRSASLLAPFPASSAASPRHGLDALDALSAFDALVLSGSNVAFWVQVQGTGLLLLLALLWFKASQLRLNEARRILRERRRSEELLVRDAAPVTARDFASGGRTAHLGNLSHDARHAQRHQRASEQQHHVQDHLQQQQQPQQPPQPQQQQPQHELPKVTVVLAVKGCAGDAGMSNWRSQVQIRYGGATEYIFCVESANDPACRAVKTLQREMRGVAEIRLVVAGLASRCSQQIHNQLAGAARAKPDSKYLLFFDDDIQSHPDTLTLLVTAMERNPSALVCTGYSFDFPGADAQTRRNLAAYAAMAYRVPVQLAMASGGKQLPVWGGCMMIRLDDLRANRYGMVSALSARGYSNDLTLSAIAASNGRDVVCPAAAIFPGRLSGSWTFQRYWNYVRRQTFALTTFCSPVALALNACGLLLYAYGSACLLAPLLPSALRVARFLLAFAARGEPAWRNLPSTGPDWDPSYPSSLTSLTSPTSLSGLFALPSFTRSAAIANLAIRFVLANASLFLALLYLSMLALATVAVVRLFYGTFTLCNVLSPEKPPLRLGSLSLVLGVAGMLVNLAVVPVVTVYTLLQPAITWAGITYVRRRGLIVEVRHPQQQPQVGQQHGEERRDEVAEERDKGEEEEIEGTKEVELEEEDAEEEQQQWLLPPLASSPVLSLKPTGLVGED
ncbi:unnamed protein product [Closterium sp. Yama58-4]|nr:unnamed protein product [Closterium sp. Yama58-4]